MEEGDLVQDRYRLVAPLGRGGMAEVWRALDERLRRPVAIKFLTSRYTDDPEFLVRFFSEAQSVARISHAHVVPVLDFGSGDESPFLVMELVEGGSLADRREPLQLERATELLAQAAEGAGAAHECGVVHRDIKPGNILLTPQGDAKLADFGIATLGSGERLTLTGTAIGSPHYISPEGATGDAGSPASDVYSLGIVLYELLTGRRPFEGTSPTAVAIAHVDESPEPPSVHRPELPAWVDAVVLKCLAKKPADRYSDGTALAEALRLGEASEAATVGRPVKFPRRKLAVAVGAIVTVAVATLLWASPGPGSVVPDAEAGTSDDNPELDLKWGEPETAPSAEPASGDVVVEETPTPSPSPEPTEPGRPADRGNLQGSPETASQTSPSEEPTENEEAEPAEPAPTATPSEPPPESEPTEPPPDEPEPGSTTEP